MTKGRIEYSVSGLYLCDIAKTEELNKGGFGARFCFKNSLGQILYQHKNSYLYELSGLLNSEEFERLAFSHMKMLQWAIDSNTAYFTEYFNTKSKQFRYVGVIINFDVGDVFFWDTAVDNFEFARKMGLVSNSMQFALLAPFLVGPKFHSVPLNEVAFSSFEGFL